MTETNGNGNGRSKFDWRTSIVTVAAVIITAAIQWGVVSAQITDHSRRLDIIEQRMAERYINREEYDHRHDDLIRQLETLRESQHSLELRITAAGK